MKDEVKFTWRTKHFAFVKVWLFVADRRVNMLQLIGHKGWINIYWYKGLRIERYNNKEHLV